nr:hypothetical protein [Candidatus Gastranaerophilales bacterium]
KKVTGDGVTDKQKDDAKAALDTKMKEIDTQNQLSQTKIAKLNQQQTLLDLEKKTLETQLQAYNNELSNVEKAEEDSIKKSAPGYVK